MVQLLLLKGADKNVLNDEHITPLFLTVCNNHADSASALLAAGADVNVRWQGINISEVHRAAGKGHADTLTVVTEPEANVNATISSGYYTPLHQAAYRNQRELIDVLVEAGANIEVMAPDLKSPLHRAAENCCAEAVVAL